jgi:hypothetical protein
MGITSMLNRNCVQVAVYWANPHDDGYGGHTFDEPYEIFCRWEDLQEVLLDDKGVQLTSKAVVYVLQDVDEEGMLYLGSLEDLYVGDSSAGDVANPMTIEGVYTIKKFQKSPLLHSTSEFVRKVYLT